MNMDMQAPFYNNETENGYVLYRVCPIRKPNAN